MKIELIQNNTYLFLLKDFNTVFEIEIKNPYRRWFW